MTYKFIFIICFLLGISNPLWSQSTIAVSIDKCESKKLKAVCPLLPNGTCCTGGITYKWYQTSVSTANLRHTGQEYTISPSSNTTYIVQMSCADGATKATITYNITVGTGNPTVTFKPAPNQKYGFDDWTNFDPSSSAGPPQRSNSKIAFKSIRKGKTDEVLCESTPGYSCVHFNSTDASNITVSPAQAASNKQILTLTGVDTQWWQAFTNVEANKGSTTGANLKKISVKTYSLKNQKIGIMAINYTPPTGLGVSGFNSTTYPSATVQSFLNYTAYRQAIYGFGVATLPVCSCDFENVNTRNNKLDLTIYPYLVSYTGEAQKIIDKCAKKTLGLLDKYPDYDGIIFLVDNLGMIGAPSIFGAWDFGEKWGFISIANHSGGSASINNTFAHELGHGRFSLRHPGPTTSSCGAEDPNSDYTDKDNLMDYCEVNKLRKFQWDIIQGNLSPY
jgi:hypothetical protein